MSEAHWTPEQIGRMTPLQLVCLAHKKPPPLSQSLSP